jgi:subtilisin family serine protease
MIAGINYVTANASSIEVANMSLGGPGNNASLAQALTNSVNAGVVYAVAAGNSNADAAGFQPAGHPDVITVSALADEDGQPGGLGGSLFCRPQSQDDHLADFSNWGAAVEIAAPGVCINSTWNNGGFNVISGTSMASPHAAGAAAVIASGDNPNSRSDVLAIRSALVNAGNFDWTFQSRGPGDVKEPLLDISDGSVFPPDGSPPGGQVVFSDNFETNQGWVTNPNGTDTATTGQWQRGDPQGSSGGSAVQLGTTTSGVNDLVTGASAGSSVGANDIDGGVTSARSPSIALPSGGTLTLSFQQYLAHLSNATSADFLRVSVVSGSSTTTVFQQLGAASVRAASWSQASVNISSFGGQTVQILVQAADAGSASLVEAAVDDLTITQS